MYYRYKIGETAQVAGQASTYVWCKDCCGHGQAGQVGLFGTYCEAGETCATCQGQGRRWVPSHDVLTWVACDDGMQIHCASAEHPLRTYSAATASVRVAQGNRLNFRDIFAHLGLLGNATA